jgi:S-DNA-T family DNA segregation ATPase FtsK/SpoIIIE
LLSGITLATDLSWIVFIDLIGKYTVFLFRNVFLTGTNLLEEHKEATVPSIDNIPEKSDPPRKSMVKTAPIVEKDIVQIEKINKQSQKQPVPKYNIGENVLPSLDLLDERDTRVIGYSRIELEEMSRLVEDILVDFNVAVTVVGFHPGPVITRFELQPAAGVKVSRISNLSKDLARALSVTSVRIVEIIPGKSVVGLEIPNREREMVTLRELLVSSAFEKAKSLLTLAMGKDISGTPLVADLGKMPHALVAGTTGSGKSVAINTMILSLLYKATPEEVRLIMIDPKMLELSVYEDIPHLLTPVVTDMKEASNALRWAVAEMERRYKLMSKMGVRNLAGFNHLIDEATARGETIRDPIFQMLNPLESGEYYPVLSKLPSIVIVIDELADMMMIVGKKVEELIARLAQKARAAGIHLILATQRPSVDVLTGLIKANVPTRISFQVSSRIDSRTILDQGGAETLLGNGDMLFLPSGTSIPIRAHGAFVDDHEVHRVVEFLKQTAPPDYLEEITRDTSDSIDGSYLNGDSGSNSESDVLYDEAVMFVTESRKASISSVQRRFKVGYNRAATMIETMEAAGVVSSAESNGSRVVLAPPPVKN